MDIIDYYKQISSILEDYRVKSMSYSSALNRIKELNKQAEDAGLGELKVNDNILADIEQFDDEMSYVEEDYSYEEESSYEEDEDEDSSYEEDSDN